MSLRFEPEQIRIGRQDPPWKIVRAFRHDRQLLVHLHNVSGGVLAGDHLDLKIEVAPGAAAQVTTTGATRLYRHRAGATASEQRTRIVVGENAILEYLPDPLIPYAGARHAQLTEIDLSTRATLFWWEILAPGRQASGEEFAFDFLRISSRIENGTRPLLRENFVLEPRRAPISAAARMHEYKWLANFNVCQVGRDPQLWTGLENQLNEVASARSAGNVAIWGASTLAADGVTVRGLAASGRHIHATLLEFWRIARRAVTGADAIPPRKIY